LYKPNANVPSKILFQIQGLIVDKYFKLSAHYTLSTYTVHIMEAVLPPEKNCLQSRVQTPKLPPGPADVKLHPEDAKLHPEDATLPPGEAKL